MGSSNAFKALADIVGSVSSVIRHSGLTAGLLACDQADNTVIHILSRIAIDWTSLCSVGVSSVWKGIAHAA